MHEPKLTLDQILEMHLLGSTWTRSTMDSEGVVHHEHVPLSDIRLLPSEASESDSPPKPTSS